MIDDIIEEANNLYPWDAGYRIDFYRRIAAELIQIANELEEDFEIDS